MIKRILPVCLRDKPYFICFQIRYRITNEELVDGDRTKLIIEKAERKDSALFTCTAINDYGEDSMNIQLIVQGG